MRDAVLRVVVERPGVSVSAIASALGVDASSAAYHLHRLEKERRVAAVTTGRVRAYWASGSGFCPLQRTLLPRLPSEARALFGRLAAAASPVAQPIGPHPAPSSARWAVEVLLRTGLANRAHYGALAVRPVFVACGPAIATASPCRKWGACAASRAWPHVLDPDARTLPSAPHARG